MSLTADVKNALRPLRHILGRAIIPAQPETETIISRTNFRYMYWSSAQQLVGTPQGRVLLQRNDQPRDGARRCE